MLDLLRLIAGLIVAAGGFALIAEGDVWAGYRLRDGLLVATLGALIAILPVSARAATATLTGGRQTWPQAARTLTLTGLVCSVAAAAILTWLGQSGWPATAGGALWSVGLLALLIGLFWPGRTVIYPTPAYRWSLDAAGRFVRQALGQDGTSGAELAARWRPITALIFLVAMGLGAWLRMRHLTALPPTCIAGECEAVLLLAEGTLPATLGAAGLGLHAALSRALLPWSEDALAAYRWAAAILGTLALPVWFWAARGVMRAAGAAVGVLGLALLPWAIWGSRIGSDWSAYPLLMALVIGAAARGLSHRTRRWWGAAGIFAGLLLLQPTGAQDMPWLLLAWVLWLLGLAALVWWLDGRTRRAFGEQSLVLVGSAFAVGLPVLLPRLAAAPLDPAVGDGWLLLSGLLHRGGGETELFRHSPLLPVWVAGAAWVGLAGLLRSARVPRGHAGLLFSAWLLPGVAILAGASGDDAAVTWLVWLVPLTLAAALSVDALLTHFAHLWVRLIPPSRVVLAAAVVIAVWLGGATWDLNRHLSRAGGTPQSAAEVSMAQYLARCLAGEVAADDGLLLDDPCRVQGDGAPLFIVPSGVLGQPATRLLLGQAISGGRIRAFDPSRDLIPVELPAGDLFFLVSLDNQPLIDLLPTLYPGAELRVPTLREQDAGPTTFITVRIPRTDLAAHRGLLGEYYAGLDNEVAGPALVQRDGATAFAWRDFAPLPSPFHAIWEATLLVPSAGAYVFSIGGDLPTGPDAAVIHLTIDGRVVLDTSLGLMERRETLAQGPARLALHYRGAAPPGDWAIRWASDELAAQPIPAHLLVSPPLPDIGLTGVYQPADGQGAALALRKDLVLGVDPGLAQPYRVRWQGTLAAPRAGEYLFAVTANGALSLAVNQRRVLEHLPVTPAGSGPAYSQGSLYLPAGRHAIEIDYAPAGPAELRLLWQAPGSAPTLLLSRYLAPRSPETFNMDTPLPAAPPLVDARLGDDNFALTVSMEFDQPALSLPPEELSLLLAEPVWTLAAGCGEEAMQLNSPRGMALDAAANRLYVADALNRRVAVVDMERGVIVSSLTLDGFEEPVDVALESSGALLVLDALAQALYRLDPSTGDGAALALGTSFYRPRGFAVDATGNIGVADTGGARVVLLDTSGTPFAQFGGPGTVLGSGQPVDVVTVNGEWWTITAENGRLWRLDGLGSLPAIPRTNTLTGPHLAALPDGAFFLSDPARRSVLYFAPNGRPLAQLGYADSFANPTGLAATMRDGYVYLAVGDSAACSISLWRLRPA